MFLSPLLVLCQAQLITYPWSLLWLLCPEDSELAFCFKQESISFQDRDVGLTALRRELSPWAVSQLASYSWVWRALCSATLRFQQGHGKSWLWCMQGCDGRRVTELPL